MREEVGQFDNGHHFLQGWFSTPPLTTICQPHIEIGTHAVNMLLKQIRQPEIRQDSIHLPGSLIIRGSTKPL
ncbi:MAG TPA: hypothetical protein DIT94_12235 [Deltaproteobacteria bacterium]|nr:hypothetical protein [Deltaproteobacteria bacterium]